MKISQILNNKNIIIGITGGIAAYKICYLIRFLKKAGANVKVVATRHALHFVTELTLSTLSGNTVYCDVISKADIRTEHISLSDWGDILIVAPATANIIAKFANGIADDALSTLFVAFNKKVLIAPAMNSKMFDHYTTIRNMQFLESNGVSFINPEYGDLACNYQGKGRMAEPEYLFNEVVHKLLKTDELTGKTFLISAGPTEEDIDPVRYLSNRSSGKMGYELAKMLSLRGAEVHLVSGPTEEIPWQDVHLYPVKTASEMSSQLKELFPNSDYVIMAAAVADLTFKKSSQKIKKNRESSYLECFHTEDILQSLGNNKTHQQLIGFALESENLLENGREKLQSKNLDMIVLNQITKNNPALGVDFNDITILDSSGHILKNYRGLKSDLANIIIDQIINNS